MSNVRTRRVKTSKSPKLSTCQNLCKSQGHIFASAQIANEYLWLPPVSRAIAHP
ncbi:hypothetical protein [Phormidium nigroviride]